MPKEYFDEKLNDNIIDAGTPNWFIDDVKANDDYTLLLTFVTLQNSHYISLYSVRILKENIN